MVSNGGGDCSASSVRSVFSASSVLRIRSRASFSTETSEDAEKDRNHGSQTTKNHSPPGRFLERMFPGTLGFDDRPGRAQHILVRSNLLNRDRLETEPEGR
jgi:hypothetical protein